MGGCPGILLKTLFWGVHWVHLPRRYLAPIATPRMELGLALMAEWRELIVSLTARWPGGHILQLVENTKTCHNNNSRNDRKVRSH